MSYQLEYSEEAYRSIRKLPGNYRQRIRRLIESLTEVPRPAKAKELRSNPNGYRIWVDLWRVIYRVDDEREVVFIAAIRQKQGPETYEDIQWN